MANPDDADAAARSRQSSDSSLTTFYTSLEMVEQDGPGGDEMTGAAAAAAMEAGYKAAGAMKRDLREHCRILLDERIYTSAISLLTSMLGAGASRRQPIDKPAPIPPPSHLALLATVAVHPLSTTRADKAEHEDVPGRALAYLRSVLAVAGPIHADFRAAFRFREPSRRRRAAADSDSEPMSGESDADSVPMRNMMANEGSVWQQGKDFWHTVGWAFRCCTAMPHRWRYWRAWVEFMVDVLEADWAERTRIDEEVLAAGEEESETETEAGRGGRKREKKKKNTNGKNKVPTAAREESMMAMYMDQKPIKEIVRALVMYGESPWEKSYREVFLKEHRGPRRPSLSAVGKRKRERELDVANGRFGDYLDDEGLSSGISEPPTPRKPRAKRDGDVLGGGMAESVGARLRLFKLASAVAFTLRAPADLDTLYGDFAKEVAALPVDVFAAVVSQRPNALLLETHVTLTRGLFGHLLPTSIRSPQRADPEMNRTGGLSAAMLEQCYACHAAVGAEADDNAKLSLLVESAVQLLWICGLVPERTDGLERAVERGIEAREKKVSRKAVRGRGKAENPDANAIEVLRLSAERIRVLMSVLRSGD